VTGLHPGLILLLNDNKATDQQSHRNDQETKGEADDHHGTDGPFIIDGICIIIHDLEDGDLHGGGRGLSQVIHHRQGYIVHPGFEVYLNMIIAVDTDTIHYKHEVAHVIEIGAVAESGFSY